MREEGFFLDYLGAPSAAACEANLNPFGDLSALGTTRMIYVKVRRFA